MPADYYDLLEVPRDASAEDIKRVYRQMARRLHPDTNDDPEAEARFKEVALAYEVLSDPDKRQRYDRFGPDGVAASDPFGGGGINDIFDAFFGGNSPFGGGGRRGPAGPPRWVGPRGGGRPLVRGGGLRRPPPGRRADGRPVRALRGHRREPARNP